MKLDDIEVQAAYYGLAAFVRQRKEACRPLPPEVGRLYERLDKGSDCRPRDTKLVVVTRTRHARRKRRGSDHRRRHRC